LASIERSFKFRLDDNKTILNPFTLIENAVFF